MSPEIIKSPELLIKFVIDLIKSVNKNYIVILVGGCSRTGKTTLSKILEQEIKYQGLNSLVVCIDHWLKGIEERETNSKVYCRYDVNGIEKAFVDLLKNRTVFPPVYDHIARKRLKDMQGQPLQIQRGVLIIEGTITLAIKNLIEKSDLNIYLSIPDCSRIKRLINFYSQVKRMNKVQYKDIILSRENEEIPFIKRSSRNAHVILQF